MAGFETDLTQCATGGTSQYHSDRSVDDFDPKGDSPWRDWEEVPKIIFVTSLEKNERG